MHKSKNTTLGQLLLGHQPWRGFAGANLRKPSRREEHVFPKTSSGPGAHALERSLGLSADVIEVSWKTLMRRQKNDGGPCQNSRSDIGLLVTMVKWESSSDRATDCLSLTRPWCSGSSYWRASVRQHWAPLMNYYVVSHTIDKCFQLFFS